MSFSGGVSSHEEGRVAVAYHSNGVEVITGGADGEIKVFANSSSTEQPTHNFFADSFNVTCIRQWGGFLAAASESWSLQKWSYPEGDKMGFLGKFAGNITHFSLNFSQTKVVVGSEEFTIKLTDLESEEQHTIKGHTAPILRTAFGEEYFASSSCDGSLRVWGVESRDQLMTRDLYPRSGDVDLSKVSAPLHFDRHENLYAAKEVEVVVYKSGTWGERCVYKGEDLKSGILEMEFSHCRRFLVIGCKDGTLSVWDTRTDRKVNTLKCVSSPYSIATHPKEYKMLVGDNRGYWRECSEYLAASMIAPAPTAQAPTGSAITVAAPTGSAATGSASTAPAPKKEERGSEQFFDMEAEDDEGDWDDDIDQDILNLDRREVEDAEAVSKRYANIINDEDEDDSPSLLQIATLPEARSSTPPPAHTERAASPEPAAGPGFEMQEAFQVSSSPDHLKYRYLVWNHVGIITSRDDEEGSFINIEFHDSTTHHPLHMVNTPGYTLGTLSETAYALAANGADAKSSVVQVNVFSSWTSPKDWSVTLPEGERAVCISISSTTLSLLSDGNYLRTWSVGGLQKHVISLAGDPVTLASHNHLISAVHYSGSALSLSLLDTKKPRLIYSGPVPLSPNASLTWAGFTPGSLPVVYDSEGVLRALLPQSGLLWVPLSDLKVSKRNVSDTYWLTSVTESALHCVLCRGVTYPGVSPRPILSVLPLTMPLCDAGSERTLLEQGRLLNFVSTYDLGNSSEKEWRVEERDREETTHLLKLMALAVKNGRDHKAFELARLMPSLSSLEMAARYASKSGRAQLAQKINNLLRNWDEEKDEEENDIFVTGEVSYNPVAFADTIPERIVVENVSKPKKRVIQIDETVEPLRLREQRKEEVEEVVEEVAPDTHATPSLPSNPFSVTSTETKNTQRRSTSFLESIESKGLQQKKRTEQKERRSGGNLTLSDLGKKSSFLKIGRVVDVKPTATRTKKGPGRPKKRTGYSMWFEAQEGLEPKQGPLKWRHLPQEEKDRWLEAAKAPETPESSIADTLKKTKPIPKEQQEQQDSGEVVKEGQAREEDEESENLEVETEKQGSEEEAKELGRGREEEEEEEQGRGREEEETKENTNQSNRSSKRRLSAEGDMAASNRPAKKLNTSVVSGETKNKLAAFQFKRKET